MLHTKTLMVFLTLLLLYNRRSSQLQQQKEINVSVAIITTLTMTTGCNHDYGDCKDGNACVGHACGSGSMMSGG